MQAYFTYGKFKKCKLCTALQRRCSNQSQWHYFTKNYIQTYWLSWQTYTCVQLLITKCSAWMVTINQPIFALVCNLQAVQCMWCVSVCVCLYARMYLGAQLHTTALTLTKCKYSCNISRRGQGEGEVLEMGKKKEQRVRKLFEPLW